MSLFVAEALEGHAVIPDDLLDEVVVDLAVDLGLLQPVDMKQLAQELKPAPDCLEKR